MIASEPTTRAVFLVDDAGAIVTWNHDCEVLFGIGVAGILNQEMGTLLAGPSASQLADTAIAGMGFLLGPTSVRNKIY